MRMSQRTLAQAAVFATLMAIVVPTLAMAQATEPWRLNAEVELSMAPRGAPELTLSARLHVPRGRLAFQWARSLEQTPTSEVSWSQSLNISDGTVGTRIDWIQGHPPRAELTLGLNKPWAEGELKLSVPPAPLRWTLTGSLTQDPWTLKLNGLSGGLHGDVKLDGLRVDWGLTSQAAASAQLKPTQSAPLQLEAQVPLGRDVEFEGTLRTGIDPSRTDLRWQNLDARLERGPLEASLEATPSGWSVATLRASTALGATLRAGAAFSIDPQGWRESRFNVDRRPNSEAKYGSRLIVSPSGWRLQGSGRWSPFERPISLDGEAVLANGQLRRARLNGRATPGSLLMDGLFDYSANAWLLDLSGKLDRGPWTWAGGGSWLSGLGWDGSQLGLSRTILSIR